jgi:hypothetical protein
MATKKMAAKKPATTTPPAKKPVTPTQTTPKKNVDDAEMKAYIKAQGAAKDKKVAAHNQGLKDKDKAGYTNAQIDLYKNLAGKGTYSNFGTNYNFLTGQGSITDFDKKYVPGAGKGSRDRVLTSDGKKELSKAGMPGGRTDAFPSQDYLKPSQASRMGDKDLRKQFVNDSINTQGRKEEHLNIARNYGRVARLYGMQTSQVGAGGKKQVKK